MIHLYIIYVTIFKNLGIHIFVTYDEYDRNDSFEFEYLRM